MNERIYYSQDAEHYAQQQRTIQGLILMVVGLAVGSVLALLFAPTKGEDVRKELVNHAERAYDNSREATGKTLEKLQKDFDKLSKDVEERIKNA